MSLLVRYTLKSADDAAHQKTAMAELVKALSREGVAADYTAFSTDDPTRFVGILEFRDAAGKDAFLQSTAFAAYKQKVGPTFANPPETTEINLIGSTRL